MAHAQPTPQEGPLPLVDPRKSWHREGVYNFLIESDYNYNDPVRVILDLKAGISKLPPTCATFRINRVLSEFESSAVSNDMMTFVGSWRDLRQGRAGSFQYTNPRYPDSYLCSDAITECECGTHVLRMNNVSKKYESILQGAAHAEDCTVAMRERTNERVRRRRIQIVKTMLLLGHPIGMITGRLGIDESTLFSFTEKNGISVRDYRRHAKRLTAATCRELLETHCAYTLGALFDCRAETITRLVNDYHDVDLRALSARRRELSTRDAWTPPGGVHP